MKACLFHQNLSPDPPSPLKKLWDKEYMSDLKLRRSISDPGNKNAASRKQIKNTEIEIIGNRTSPKYIRVFIIG